MTMHDVPARTLDPYDPMFGIRAPMQVSISVNTRWSVLWVNAMKALGTVFGDRMIRPARWGALRLVRVRFDDGPWRWLRLDDTDEEPTDA